MSLTSVLSAMVLGVAAFLATSGDNLVILLGLYGGRAYRDREVAVGYVVAIAIVVAVGRLLAAFAHRAPPGVLGYLGIVPLALGVRQLILLATRRAPLDGQRYRPPASMSGVAAVAAMTLGSSADSLATFAAVLSDTRPPLGLVVLATAVACASGLAVGARRLVDHTALGAVLSRVAPYVLPFLLIAIGLFVLADTPTDMLARP